MQRIALIWLLLTAPAYALTPVDCRSIGVWVEDGSAIAGQVMTTEPFVDWCQGEDIAAGCPRYIGHYRAVRQWKVYALNACAERHVRCHAEYQTYAHTLEFPNNDELQAWLQECPP